MGKRGPAPRPSALEDLMGRPGKRAKNTHEPSFDALNPRSKPPAHLTDVAAKEWRRIVPLLSARGLLTQVDRVALEIYCEAYSTFVYCAKVMKEKGIAYKTANGNFMQLPHSNVKQGAINVIMTACARFGMTPSDRARMQVFGDNSHEEVDPMEELLAEAGAAPDLKLIAGGGGK